MFIAHVTFQIAADNADFALKTLTQDAATVRTMPGCAAYVPFAVADAGDTVGVMHEWETAADFDAYLQSDAFATIGQTLRPLMTAPPVSKRFDATPAAAVQ